MKNTVIATAWHELKVGDLVYFNYKKRNWLMRILLFWKKPIAYKITEVEETSITIGH